MVSYCDNVWTQSWKGLHWAFRQAASSWSPVHHMLLRLCVHYFVCGLLPCVLVYVEPRNKLVGLLKILFVLWVFLLLLFNYVWYCFCTYSQVNLVIFKTSWCPMEERNQKKKSCLFLSKSRMFSSQGEEKGSTWFLQSPKTLEFSLVGWCQSRKSSF